MAARTAPRRSCYDQAIALLALRAHTSVELERKLVARSYAASQVRETLARLRGDRLLDDEAAGQALRSSLERRGYGPRRVLAEMQRRGAPATNAAEGREGEFERALAAAGRFLRSAAGRPRRGEALARHLDRRGFGARVIVAVLRQNGLPELPLLADAPDEQDEQDG